MSYNPDPGKRSKRLSPDELAQEVAELLKKDTPGPSRRRLPRFDIVNVSRIVLALGVIFLGLGTAFAVSWVGRLSGYEATGTVMAQTPVFGCPEEPDVGALFTGETVRIIGRSDDAGFYALRDERGPEDVVYADVAAIGAVEDPERLPGRSCQPRDPAQVLAAATSTAETALISSTVPTATSGSGASTPTTTTPAVFAGQPPRRGASGPGTTTTITFPAGPGSPSTTSPPHSSTTSLPGTPSSTTGTAGTTTTTRASTTTTSTSTTSTLWSSTTTTTTTTEPPTTTTTTEPSTTTTEPPTTTTSATLP